MKYVLICDNTITKCILVDGKTKMDLDANPYHVAELLNISAINSKILEHFLEIYHG